MNRDGRCDAGKEKAFVPAWKRPFGID